MEQHFFCFLIFLLLLFIYYFYEAALNNLSFSEADLSFVSAGTTCHLGPRCMTCCLTHDYTTYRLSLHSKTTCCFGRLLHCHCTIAGKLTTESERRDFFREQLRSYCWVSSPSIFYRATTQSRRRENLRLAQ